MSYQDPFAEFYDDGNESGINLDVLEEGATPISVRNIKVEKRTDDNGNQVFQIDFDWKTPEMTKNDEPLHSRIYSTFKLVDGKLGEERDSSFLARDFFKNLATVNPWKVSKTPGGMQIDIDQQKIKKINSDLAKSSKPNAKGYVFQGSKDPGRLYWNLHNHIVSKNYQDTRLEKDFERWRNKSYTQKHWYFADSLNNVTPASQQVDVQSPVGDDLSRQAQNISASNVDDRIPF